MIALGMEQTVVFVIIAGVGYWVVSLILNRIFPGKLPADESDNQEVTLSAQRRPYDALTEQLCPDDSCGEANPQTARYCSRCGRALQDKRRQ